MLTQDQKTNFKAKLEAEKLLLEEELGQLGVKDPTNPGDWVAGKPEGDEFGADRTDNADVIEKEGQNSASLNELEMRLGSVVRALSKMHGDTFGVCEVSGHDIELDRLTANPAARTCKEHMQTEATLP